MSKSIFSGRISSITYEDGAGFVIAKIQLDNGKPVVAKGRFPGQPLSAGTWVCFEGEWLNHPQYGPQLSVVRSPVMPDDWNNDRVCAILSAQGVGPFIRSELQMMASSANCSILDILEDRADLSAVHDEKLDENDFDYAVRRWKAAKAHLYAASFLAEAGVPSQAIDRVWKIFGTDLEEVVTENPWRLVGVEGITFKEADEVARRLGVDLGSPLRVQGAVLSAVSMAPQEGHVFTTLTRVISRVQEEIPSADNAEIAGAVKALVASKSLTLDREIQPGVVAIYDPGMYELEESCVQLLAERLKAVSVRDMSSLFSHVGANSKEVFDSGGSLEDVARAALKDWSLGSKTDLTADQSQAALRALTDPVSLLTGLPGTGKTTTLRAAVSVLKDSGVNFLLIAPTGIAAKRLSSVVNAPASTIHRAFGAKSWSQEDDGREATYEGVTGESSRKSAVDVDADWGFGPGNPHPAEVAVVDETSMVDLRLLHRILTGTKPDCRLVFVGDPYQLPSVGAGDVLGDMVEAKVFPHSHLSQIFRQEGTSGIVLAAHAIHQGFNPKSDGKDFVILDSASEENAAGLVLDLAKGLYTRRANFQVLSPRHSGAAGVTALNEKIRSELNPPSSGMIEVKMGGSVVREGDRIMVVKNDYDRGVYNGDVGTVRRIDRVAKDVEVSIFGAPGTPSSLVRFPFKDAVKSLRLAYTQTIHKCVSPDTIVWANGGLHRIEHIPERGWISGPDGAKYYRNKVVNPNAPAIRITTYHGYILTGTLDHGIDVWDQSQGKYVRKELQELSEKDWVRLVPSPTESVENPPEIVIPSVTGAEKRYPHKMTPELAEFIGLVLAFGDVSAAGPRIFPWKKIFWQSGIVDPTNILDRFTSLADKLFGVSVEISHRTGFANSTDSIYPSAARAVSKPLARWFTRNLGLLGLGNQKDRFIPSLVMSSSKECKSAFLRGFFYSARMTYVDPVTKRPMHESRVEERSPDRENLVVSRVWARSINPRIDSELRALLLDFGVIVSRTVGFKPHMWKGFNGETKIILRGEDISRFQLKIGFPTRELQEVAALLKKTNPRSGRIPISNDERDQLRKVCKNVVTTTNTVSTSVARKVSGMIVPNHIVGIMADKLRFFHDWIFRIELVESPSVCVEVHDGHRFIQNGFSAWNSQGQEYDVIVLPLLNSFGKQLQRNLLYTAITRARKRVFIVGQTSAVSKAVGNNSAEDRNTFLAERLQKLLGG